MDSCLILRATLVGILLLGLLTPAQTKAGYLGSVKRGCQGIEPWRCGSVKRGYNYQGIKRLGYLGSYQGMKKQGYLGRYQGMKKQAALERKDHLGGMDLHALEPKDDVGSLVPQANRQGQTGAKNGHGPFGKKRHTSYF